VIAGNPPTPRQGVRQFQGGLCDCFFRLKEVIATRLLAPSTIHPPPSPCSARTYSRFYSSNHSPERPCATLVAIHDLLAGQFPFTRPFAFSSRRDGRSLFCRTKEISSALSHLSLAPTGLRCSSPPSTRFAAPFCYSTELARNTTDTSRKPISISLPLPNITVI
jgi:hypothetical protein